MENLLFLGVPILKNIRVYLVSGSVKEYGKLDNVNVGEI